ncbi:hypothetical protein PO883_34045, partial [Massilia sp. DJPM01]|uniref:hypothetical protein n=1 Tax=Massilia sp. DJPM01 TaxID=3024404 RepID=UPI00259E4CC5
VLQEPLMLIISKLSNVASHVATLLVFFGLGGAARPVLGAVPLEYSYQLSSEKIVALRKDLERIKLGDSLSNVKSALGRPSSENSVYRPKLFGPNEFAFVIVIYDIRRISKTLNNVHDEQIQLFFGKDGNLIKVISPFCKSDSFTRTGSRHCQE